MKCGEMGKKLHNEELHNLYSSPNIIRMVKPKRSRWTRNVVRVREKTIPCGILVGVLEEHRSLKTARRR
jgi:hypothetical protein